MAQKSYPLTMEPLAGTLSAMSQATTEELEQAPSLTALIAS